MNRTPSRRSTRPWHLILLAAVAIGVIVLGITEVGTTTSSARTSKEVVTAVDGVVQSTVSGSGNVEPGVDETVNFATSGTLNSVNVRVGQHVTKGQLIATLDPTSAEQTLQEDKTSLTVAQDQLIADEQAASSSGSSSTSASAAAAGSSGRSPTSSTTTSQTQKPTAAEIAQAREQVQQAQQTLDSAQTAVDQTKLYAPVSGIVASLSGTEIGQTVSAGGGSSSATGAPASSSGASSSSSSGSSSGFAQIINSKTMTMTVALGEDDISVVKVGQMATVSITALSGVELAGHVSSISPLGSASNGVVTYDATVTVTQSNPKVLPGMSATASIVTDQQQGVTVPNQAISGAGSDATVDLVNNGKVNAQAVVVGLKGSSRSVIESGLKSGQHVQITITLPALGTSTSSSSSSSSTLGGGFGGTGGLSGGLGGGRLRAFFGGGG